MQVLRVGVLIWMLVTSLLPGGSAKASVPLIEWQRQQYQMAQQHLAGNQLHKARAIWGQLKDYPLAAYLERDILLRQLSFGKREQIEHFLAEHQGQPVSHALRTAWLKWLAKNHGKTAFLASYQGEQSRDLACKHADYRLQKEGISDDLWQEVDKLWLVGHSQPKSCDDVFLAWVINGQLTQDKVWQRLRLAAKGGNTKLIPYMQRRLPKNQRYLADLWLSTRRSPASLKRLSRFTQAFPAKEAEILTYGLGRLAWQDAELALKLYPQITRQYRLSRSQQRKLARDFALALAIEEHPKASYWLEKANMLRPNKQLFRWHLTHLVRQQDWQQVLDLIDAAPEQVSQDNAYRYWQARALQALASQQADGAYAQLADQRHYYGFLASGQLGQQVALQDTPLRFNAAELTDIAKRPAARRAYELFQLKELTQARREWLVMDKDLNQQEKRVAAVLADSWGWHDQAIFGFARAGYMHDVKRRFPVAYKAPLLAGSKQYQVDPAWAFAIVRRESSFMQDANSSAGARGLMQLMPGTARYLAKKKIRLTQLYDAGKNIDYGTRYMRYLMDKMQDNQVLATASYNAGWRKVQKWLPQQASVPVDIWVETIPYKETRNYVKAVLAYQQIYALQLGRADNLFEGLSEMRIQPGSIQ